MPGRFITFEGGEGAGKSTQAGLLADWLREGRHDVVLTREPGGTPGGDAIRGLLMDGKLPLAPLTEALLFAAARAEHVERLIRPALADGKWVVCDRFLDSSIAYQGQTLGADTVTAINAEAIGELAPDLTFYLRTDPATGQSRAARRDGQRADRFAARDAGFHGGVARAFDALAERHAERIVVIDGSGGIESVETAVRDAVTRKFA